MAEQVRIDITAEDKASKTIDDVAAKVDDLESAKPEIPVTADTSQAASDIDSVLAKADRLSADPATLLLTTNAAKIAGQIADLILDLDRLDANDPTVEIKADQINTLTGDLDQVETKLKSIHGVPVDIDTKPAQQSLHKVGGEADQSRSVLANMVGNATQDLGALGGVAGTAGVAIGQLGEYATEGNIALSGLARVAGPMAALALVTQLVGSEFAKVSKAAEEQKAHVDALFKAFSEGKTVLETFTEQVASTGKFEMNMGDVLPDMAKMNVSLETFSRLVEATPAQFDAWASAQRAAVKEGTPEYHAMFQIVGALTGARLADAEATKRQQITNEVLGTSVADTAAKTADAAAKTAEYTQTQQDAADIVQSLNDMLLAQADALNKQVDAATAAADSQLAANDAFEKFGTVLGDNKASANDVRDAAIRLAKATAQVGADQAAAAGKVQTSTAKLDAQNGALLNTAAAAKGPARDGILAYIGSVNQIPPEKITEIIAAVAAGDLDRANKLLADASKPRTAAVKADAETSAANSQLDNTANPGGRPRTAHIDVAVRQAQAIYIPPGTTNIGGASATQAQPTVGVVNMRLPTGWRGDPLAEIHRTTRRAGRFYQRIGR
jgi:hypothetical protein